MFNIFKLGIKFDKILNGLYTYSKKNAGTKPVKVFQCSVQHIYTTYIYMLLSCVLHNFTQKGRAVLLITLS